MTMLRTESNMSDPDAFYAELIDLHRDLTEEQSREVNARLILLLANQVADLAVLREVLVIARESIA